MELFPDYYDLVVYRGKMYLKQGQYEESLRDFEKAIAQNGSKGFAYLGKGTCEVNLGLRQKAIVSFSLGLESDLAHVCY